MKVSREKQPAAKPKDVRIVVLQRGWVLVGEYSSRPGACRLDRASVVRVWGTTRGLGELTNGPLTGTKLDPCNGPVHFNPLTEVFSMEVNGATWSSHLS